MLINSCPTYYIFDQTGDLVSTIRQGTQLTDNNIHITNRITIIISSFNIISILDIKP